MLMDVEEPAIPPSARTHTGEAQPATSRRLPSISALLNAADSPPLGATPESTQTFLAQNGFSRGEHSSALPPSPPCKANHHEQYPTVHSSSAAAATEAGLAYSAQHPPDAPSPPPARQLTSLEFPDGNALRPLPSGLSSFNGRGRSASIPHVYGFDESRQSRFSGFATSSERHDDSAGSAVAERDTGSAGGGPAGDFGLRWSPTDPRLDPSRPRALSISTADEYRTRSRLPGAPHAASREREGRYATADSAASLPPRAPPYYPPQAGPSTYPAEPSLPPRYPYDAYRRSSLVNAPFTNPYPPYSSSPAPPPHIPLSIPSGLPGAGPVSPPSAGPSTSTFPPTAYSPVGPPPQSSWTPPAPAPPPPPAPFNDESASISDAQNAIESTSDAGRYGCPHCPKRFARPSSLRIHMHSHTGEKPFTCPLCDRAFSVQSNLRRHLKIHKGGEAKVGPSRRGGSSTSSATATPAAGSSRSTVPLVLAEEDEAMGTQPPSRPASAEGYSGGTDGDGDGDEGDAEGSVVSASTSSAPGEPAIPAPTHPQQDEEPPRPLVRTEWPRSREQAD